MSKAINQIIESSLVQKVKYKMRNNSKYLVLGVTNILLAIVAIVFYMKYTQTNNELNKKVYERQNMTLQQKVEELVEIKSKESPTILIVNDPNKLKTQLFFENVEKNDKILLYNDINKAIIYRPKTNKIVEYRAIELTDIEPTSNENVKGIQDNRDESERANSNIKISIYNSTTQRGLAQNIANKIKSELESSAENLNVELINVANAKGAYDKSFYVATRNDDFEYFEKELRINRSTLPEEEKSTNDVVNEDYILFIGDDLRDK